MIKVRRLHRSNNANILHHATNVGEYVTDLGTALRIASGSEDITHQFVFPGAIAPVLYGLGIKRIYLRHATRRVNEDHILRWPRPVRRSWRSRIIGSRAARRATILHCHAL